MSISLADIETPAHAPGPSAPFPIAPDDATRRMFLRWHAAYGDIYRVPAERGSARHWVVHDPALVQQILVRRGANYGKGLGMDRVRLLLGEGIMVSEGDFWARQRRLIQPAFKPRRLADFNAMILAENRRLADRWADVAARGETVDVAAQVSELTLVIVLKSIFGADYDRLVEHGANPFALLSEEATRDLRFAARFHRLGTVVNKIIEDRLADADSGEHGSDFLGHLLAARDRDGAAMTRRQLIDEVMTLIVAGHETTASALAWAWYLLASHPEVLAQLQAAADTLDADQIAESAVRPGPGLAWLDAAINETLRLYPPGWLLSRRALGPDRLGKHEIASGDQLFVSPYVLHRHRDYWQAAERFDPGRFLHGRQPAHRFAFLPFAAGARHCIGEQLAMTEMRIHLLTMLRRFTPVYAGDGPPALESRINLRPAGAISMRWSER